MPRVQANGIELEYERSGSPEHPVLLLVNGLGGQLIAWDDDFVQLFVDLGFGILRFDNRDVGLSTKFDDLGVPDLGPILRGEQVPVPYRLADMAADIVGLLDTLGIERVDALGVSMGGMIIQELAIRAGERLRSLCSIMSTTGAPFVGRSTKEALATLTEPAATGRDEVIEQNVRAWRVIGSPGFPFDEALVRRRAAAAYDRSYAPAGVARQLAAIAAAPPRTEGLRGVRLPALVIHGQDDPLIDVSGGRATAEALPGSELLVLAGMGHDIPRELWGTVADAVVRNTDRSTVA